MWFFGINAFAAILLVAGLCLGIVRWQQPAGKVIAVVAGLLLLLLAAFVVCVLFLTESARRGAPM